jgi:hypothetical protein
MRGRRETRRHFTMRRARLRMMKNDGARAPRGVALGAAYSSGRSGSSW